MGLFLPRFRDITLKNETMTARIGLSVFGGRFKKAQIWLDQEIMKRMEPVIPYRTGAFLGKIKAENAGRVGTGVLRTSVPPQGTKLYPGVSSRGVPFHWTNPNTQPYWGQYVIRTYKRDFVDGVRRIIGGK